MGEEWAEAPEWLPHFVTDHTDRLLLTSAAALLLVYRQTQTSIGQTDHTDRLLLVLLVYMYTNNTDHTDRLHCCCWWCTDNTDNN